MFFETADTMRPSPLTHNPFNALVAPRPIAWVSTVDTRDVSNLAPFSYFNGVSADPPYVMFAPNSKNTAGEHKDTFANILEVPEFVINIVSWEQRAEMIESSCPFDPEVDEFDAVGLTKCQSALVKPPRVEEARAALECRVHDIISLPQGEDGRVSHVIVGQVIGIHLDDDLIVDGLVDETKIRPMCRPGYFNYAYVDSVTSLQRPKDKS